MSGLRIAVTGAAGSLGRSVIKQLAAREQVASIVAIDLQRGDGPGTWIARDVRDPRVARDVAGCDVVIHLAFVVESRQLTLPQIYSINVDGTRNVCQSAAKSAVPHVVYASSVAAYGFHADNRGQLLDESAAIRGNPDFYYSHTKAICERWLDEFEAANSVVVSRLRPCFFIGPDGSRSLAIFRRPYFPYFRGMGETPLQVCHEADVADAFVRAALQPKPRAAAFNIATEFPLPMREWPVVMRKLALPIPRAAIAALEWAYERRWIAEDPVWFRKVGAEPVCVDANLAKSQLGWRPRYPTTAAALLALARN